MGEDEREYILGAQEGPGRLEARGDGGRRFKTLEMDGQDPNVCSS